MVKEKTLSDDYLYKFDCITNYAIMCILLIYKFIIID